MNGKSQHDVTQDDSRRRRTTQGDARIDSSSISALLALFPTNQISEKKQVGVYTKGVI